jgi:hypothetical protein
LQDIPLDETVNHVRQSAASLKLPCIKNANNAEYLKRMEQPGEWGDGVMLAAATWCFGRKLVLVIADSTSAQPTSVEMSSDANEESLPVYLGFISDQQHYVHLTPKVCTLVPQQPQPKASLATTCAECKGNSRH